MVVIVIVRITHKSKTEDDEGQQQNSERDMDDPHRLRTSCGTVKLLP